jgi:hypothetical protein
MIALVVHVQYTTCHRGVSFGAGVLTANEAIDSFSYVRGFGGCCVCVLALAGLGLVSDLDSLGGRNQWS